MESDNDVKVDGGPPEEIDPYICLTIEDGRVILIQSNMSSELELATVLRVAAAKVEQQIDRTLIL